MVPRLVRANIGGTTRVIDLLEQSGSIVFDADYANQGLAAYNFVHSPEGATVVNDPALGAARKVLKVTTLSSYNAVVYPRVQLQTPTLYGPGSEGYVGFGLYIPPSLSDMPEPMGDFSPVLHEFYGQPSGGYGPTVIRLKDGRIGWYPNRTYPEPVWSMPIVRGQWIDIVMRAKFSSDPAVGFVELSVNTGSGLSRVSFADGSTRYHIDTLTPGINDGHHNFSSLKVGYTDLNTASATVYFAAHRLGTGRGAVDPKSHA